MNDILIPIAVVGAIGLLFGCLLAFASIIFKVEKDERIEKIEQLLPGANCGACGFAGCSAYAHAVVNDGAPVSCCSVGGEAKAKEIAAIMGKKADKIEEKTARVMCAGTCGIAEDKYEYSGVSDCAAAARLAGGAKACPNGCLGLGTCTRACRFGALSIINGIAAVDEEKCTACGQCEKVCPKHIIALVPKKSRVSVPCSSTQKGALTNKVCKIGCIACRMCEKICPKEAIAVKDNHAVIDYAKCIGCGLCADKCPKKVIKKVRA